MEVILSSTSLTLFHLIFKNPVKFLLLVFLLTSGKTEEFSENRVFERKLYRILG